MPATRRRRLGIWAVFLVGLAVTVAVVLSTAIVSFTRLTSRLDDAGVFGERIETIEMSDSEAKALLAREFHIHIPDGWTLTRMTSMCRIGMRLNTCRYVGWFTGPAAEFDRHPALFRAVPPETTDQPPAQPITCAGLAAKYVPDQTIGIDCAAQQRLALSQLDPGPAKSADVLIAGSDTATTVYIDAAWL